MFTCGGQGTWWSGPFAWWCYFSGPVLGPPETMSSGWRVLRCIVGYGITRAGKLPSLFFVVVENIHQKT